MATTLTAITAGQSIDYIAKDFNSVVDALITYATINYGATTEANRLWSDFNLSSFSRNWLELLAYVSDLTFYYLDNQATESYLQTATLNSSIQYIAAQFGFVPATNQSASGVATFTTTSAGTIARGYTVQSISGQQFYVTNPITVGGSGQFSGNVLQGIIQTDQFTAQGIQSESFNLTGPNVIIDANEANPLDNTPQITVNGNAYTLVQSFIFSNGTDTPAVTNSLGEVIGGGGRVFILGINPDGTPLIQFGDGLFGRQLSPGDVVIATYRTQGGSAGNIGVGTLTILVGVNPIISSVTNASAFSGGVDAQTIQQLAALIPASLKTLQRAVSLEDFADILTVNFPQVFAANAAQNTTTPAVDVDIYVVPQGNGIPQISDNIPLKNSLISFLDVRKMVTVQFQILDAFGLNVLISLRVFINNGVSQTTVTNNIASVLQDFFNLTTGGPNGTGLGFAAQVLMKDISTVLDTVPGIQRYEFLEFSYSPRIQQNIQSDLTSYDVTPVTIFPSVGRYEWLLGASGELTTPSGNTLFSNTELVSYSYTSGTGIIQYSSFVDLSRVFVGSQFKDGAATLFTVLGFSTSNNQIIIATGQSVDTTVGSDSSGSVISSAVAYEAYTVFRKYLGSVTNLTGNTLTDNNLDLSVDSGTGVAVEATLLLDNGQTFIPNQYATGLFLLVDSAGNIWNILANTSNSIRTSVTAINNAAITNVSPGAYNIVTKLGGQQVVFNGEVFNIEYNTVNTLFSTAAEFDLIGTIGNNYEISQIQSNKGNLGMPVDIVEFNSGMVSLNSSVDLSGISSQFELIDSSGQVFNITGTNNSSEPVVFYDSSEQTNEARLSGSGSGITPLQYGVKLAQGFQVPTSASYSLASFNLQRQGNIQGTLVAEILGDSGGLPNLSSVLATSNLVSVSSIMQDSSEEILFAFPTPPSLASGTQYHLAVSGDSLYDITEVSNVTIFSNTGLVSYAYNPSTGLIQYGSSVGISSAVPGNYFQDGAGNLFLILSINAAAFQVTIATSQTINNTVGTAASGAIIQDDRVVFGIDDSHPSFPTGEMSRFNGTAWSNSTLGPNPSSIPTDMVFSVQGVKTITVESNLTPVFGTGATISQRYYDDNNEISLIIGLAKGTITSASDVNPDGIGTVAGIPNQPVDSFVFRTSPYIDDITNLRDDEIPQIQTSGINLTLFGGTA